MPAVTLKAPFDIPPNSSLMVTVLPATETVVGDDWGLAARKALADAYSPDEPEYGTSSALDCGNETA